PSKSVILSLCDLILSPDLSISKSVIMALYKSDKSCLRNRETSPFWCADVLVFVQWNEAAIVRLLTVSARFSGKGMAAVCYHVMARSPG
ncbi:hypothetical protein, partial [Escherichia marmotae]|uniref:hypothetical protein n=1 Tax=Escherichia marmotae TaxID=1499973 RepID=UPI003D98C30B